MLSFRVGDLLAPLAERAQPNETGRVCRRDLRRYYWLLALALESAPPIAADVWEELAARARIALASPTAADDLAAAVFVCLGALPGWNPWQLFAVADRLEATYRRTGTVLPEGVRVGQGAVGVDPHQP